MQNKTPKERLEALIKTVNAAEEDIKAGKHVDMRALDHESLILHKELKQNGKQDPEVRALLLKSVGALERVIDHLQTKAQK